VTEAVSRLEQPLERQEREQPDAEAAQPAGLRIGIVARAPSPR
jgi:hypothetical protein